MPRPRQRVCLQDGLKLDLNGLAQKGPIKHGANIGGRGITWTHSYWGEIATGFITADMSGNDEGWFRIQPTDERCQCERLFLLSVLRTRPQIAL
jgi:hypothetical protein